MLDHSSHRDLTPEPQIDTDRLNRICLDTTTISGKEFRRSVYLPGSDGIKVRIHPEEDEDGGGFQVVLEWAEKGFEGISEYYEISASGQVTKATRTELSRRKGEETKPIENYNRLTNQLNVIPDPTIENAVKVFCEYANMAEQDGLPRYSPREFPTLSLVGLELDFSQNISVLEASGKALERLIDVYSV